MTSDQFISVRETAQILGVTERKVMDLIEEEKLRAYKIADQFLRLKKTEVLGMKQAGEVVAENISFPYTAAERTSDFFYFNDFYLAAAILMAVLLYFIFYA